MPRVAEIPGTPPALLAVAHATGWVLDVDGCLVRTVTAGGTGGAPFAGAQELLRWLRVNGRRFIICTNASQRPATQYAAQLRAMGLDVANEEMVTAATAAAAHIAARHPGAHALSVGALGLREALIEQQVELCDPKGALADVVVVGAADSYSTADLNAACLAVADRGAPLYVTVGTPWFHGGIGRAVSASTAIAHAIAAITGTRPLVCGKPSAAMAGVLGSRLGLDGGEIVVVGDSAAAEMALAHEMNALGVLVLSGATSAAEVSGLPVAQRPHLCADDVGDLLKQIESVSTHRRKP